MISAVVVAIIVIFLFFSVVIFDICFFLWCVRQKPEIVCPAIVDDVWPSSTHWEFLAHNLATLINSGETKRKTKTHAEAGDKKQH